MLYHQIFSLNLVWNSKSTIKLDILLPVLYFLLFLLFIFWVPPVLFLAITDRVWCIQYRPNLGRYPQGVKAISQVSWCFRWGRAGQYGHWVKILIQEANPAYGHISITFTPFGPELYLGPYTTLVRPFLRSPTEVWWNYNNFQDIHKVWFSASVASLSLNISLNPEHRLLINILICSDKSTNN